MKFYAEVAPRLYVAGKTEDGFDHVSTSFRVWVTAENGRRWEHNEGFSTHYYWADKETGEMGIGDDVAPALEKAEKLAARVNVALEAGRKLKRAYWREIDPAYGSDAYDRQGVELDRWMEERIQATGRLF